MIRNVPVMKGMNRILALIKKMYGIIMILNTVLVVLIVQMNVQLIFKKEK